MARPRSTLSMPANLHYQSRNLDLIVDPPICKKNGFTKSPGAISKSPSKESIKDNKDPKTFTNRYKSVCNSMHIQPLNMVKVLLSNISLEITCDRIKFTDIMAILKTIQDDRSLHYICLKSKLKGFVVQEFVDTERKAREADKALFTRYVVDRMADSLRECLLDSENLNALKLQCIPFAGNSTQLLCQGLRCTPSLQHLSLEGCLVGDEGCQHLCRALRVVPTLLTLNLTECRLTPIGAKYIAELIKGQEIARLEQGWKQSLRYREVNNDEMKGLRRITLNDNPDIGDEGFELILEVLMDDFWIRALDVQNCGVTDVGAERALKMIYTNKEITVLDLRRNLMINNNYVTEIVKAVSEHMDPEKPEYGWLLIPKSRKVSAAPFDSISTAGNFPWNCGPGTRKTKSVAGFEQAAKTSIMKVKEWGTSRENDAVKVLGTPQTKEEILNDTGKNQSIFKDISLNDFQFNESQQIEKTVKNDPQIVLIEKKQNYENNRAEDIELLFCTFINSSGIDDKRFLQEKGDIESC